MAISVASEQRIELLGTVELLHDHLTTSLCQTVFQQTRTTERERQWSLEALASFWTEANPAMTSASPVVSEADGVCQLKPPKERPFILFP